MVLPERLHDASAKPEALRNLDDYALTYPLNNSVCLKLSSRTALFFEGGGDVERRLEGFRILADYALRYRDYISHVQHATKGKTGIVPVVWDGLVSEGEARIRELPADKECEIGFFGSPFSLNSGGISQFGGSLVATKPDQLLPVDINCLEFSISHTALVDEGFGSFVSVVLEACDRLKPLHGVAGPSIQFDRIYSTTAAYLYSFPLIKRFPGLHCGRDSTFKVEIQDSNNSKIFTTNWLTVVSDSVLGQSRETAKALSKLPSNCLMHKYDGGVLVQAGPYPQIGDNNRGLVLDDYRRVARALKPIRFEDYRVGLLDVEEPLDSLDETLKWIRRFD